MLTVAGEERWSKIVGFESRYEVSDFGRVRSLPRKFQPVGRIMQQRMAKDGYVSVALYNGENKAKQSRIHRLVCLAFNGIAPEDLPDVNHKNGIKNDNHFSNLEWTNDSLNRLHAYHVLGHKSAINKPWLGKFGKDHHGSKPVIRFGGCLPEKRYEAVSSVSVDGFSFKHVSAVCRGQRQRHGGFFWRFEKV